MKIFTSLNIGSFHTNNCEDFLISEPISKSQHLIAVLDGCTMGKESVFASILFGKVLRNVSKQLFYEDFKNPSQLNLKQKLKRILQLFFKESLNIKQRLNLETEELLSTLVIGIIDKETYKAEFLTVGDGLICVDKEFIEYDQQDKPDYIGYHLNKDFETWYIKQDQRLSVNNFSDLSIATDGIFTFKSLKNKSLQKTESEIINYLLNDTQYIENKNFLDIKIKKLNDFENHIVTDDLAIIRLIKS